MVAKTSQRPNITQNLKSCPTKKKDQDDPSSIYEKNWISEVASLLPQAT